MTAALLLGGGFGLGVVCIARGLWPPRPSLAESLAPFLVSQPPPPIAGAGPRRPAHHGAFGDVEDSAIDAITRLLRRRAPGFSGALAPARRRADLAILGTSAERHAAERVLVAVAGALVAAVLSGSSLLIVDIPVTVPIWMAVVFGATGFVAPALDVHSRARGRREEMRDVLAAFVYVVSLSLAASNGVQTALRDGVSAADGWAWRQLRRALEVARYGRETPWEAIGRLGEELQVDELEELAARVRLAESDGARIQSSLITFAQTLRARRLAQVERRERARILEMTAACCVLAIAFTLFLIVPAFAGLVSH